MKELNYNFRTDEELVSAHKNGDNEASSELVARYTARLHNFLGGTSDAMDLVQETFKKVFSHIHSFNEKKSFKSWLFQIARNCSIDESRKAGIRFNLHNTEEFLEVEDCTSKTPSTLMTTLERKDIILKSVQELPEKQREVLSLSYFQGLSYPEIAKKLNCSVSSVKTHMSRAVQKLAKSLPNSGGLL